jgi:hypothetical protein
LLAVEFSFAVEHLGNRRHRYADLCRELGLRNAAGFDQVPKHLGIRNFWHGMRLVLIALDDVGEDIEVILLASGEIALNEQGLEHLNRDSQLAIGPQVP